MGKSTHFSGQPVYHQVIKLLDKQQIKQISLETPRSEAYVKRLDGEGSYGDEIPYWRSHGGTAYLCRHT